MRVRARTGEQRVVVAAVPPLAVALLVQEALCQRVARRAPRRQCSGDGGDGAGGCGCASACRTLVTPRTLSRSEPRALTPERGKVAAAEAPGLSPVLRPHGGLGRAARWPPQRQPGRFGPVTRAVRVEVLVRQDVLSLVWRRPVRVTVPEADGSSTQLRKERRRETLHAWWVVVSLMIVLKSAVALRLRCASAGLRVRLLVCASRPVLLVSCRVVPGPGPPARAR